LHPIARLHLAQPSTLWSTDNLDDLNILFPSNENVDEDENENENENEDEDNNDPGDAPVIPVTRECILNILLMY
jgi:hypothetical protein